MVERFLSSLESYPLAQVGTVRFRMIPPTEREGISMRIPLPRNTDISLIKHLRGNFEFYKKELAKNPDYGKKRAQRDKKRSEFFEKDQ